MKAVETQLLKFLQERKQFVIPIYQRSYSWTKKQCEQLWKDVLNAATNDEVSGHFIGSIVYIAKGLYQISDVPQVLVIDGQQRLTTVSLLLAAYGLALEENNTKGEINKEKIDNLYLFNTLESSDLKYKILLTRKDKDTLIQVFENNELLEPVSIRIQENFKYFKEQIDLIEIDLMQLNKGLAKLLIVDISLDKDHDNPQLIFESLNSTGLALSHADLIRNYILMGLEPKHQEELYNNYWYPMEKSFGQTAYVKFFDWFVRDYLTVKLGRIPVIREVYEEFKNYSRSEKSGDVNELVADIFKFSKYYVRIALDKEEEDPLIQSVLKNIHTLKVDVAYPFILVLFDDYADNIVSKEEVIEILKLIENYVFRRAVCGIPTNSLNKTFAALIKDIDKECYLESIKAAFCLMDGYRRYPDDKEFSREIVVKDLYNFRSRNYWLQKLENFNSKELVNVEDLTIEHIMPQNENISKEWQNELGENWKEIHKHYLHTLGNLTLTGYNSELSDKPFLKKRDMEGGFADSPLRLNKGLAKLDCWNEEEIKKRAKRLSKTALKVWIYPDIEESVLEKYMEDEKTTAEAIYSIDEHPFLKNDIPELYDLLRKRILNLDSSVREEIKKLYVAYKTNTNFADIVGYKNHIRITLNMRFEDIKDPDGKCRDVSGLGHWGNGEIELNFTEPNEIEDVIFLIRQSFDLHCDNSGE